MRKSLSEEFGVGGVAIYGFNPNDYNSTVEEIYNELGLDEAMDSALGELSDMGFYTDMMLSGEKLTLTILYEYYKIEEN